MTSAVDLLCSILQKSLNNGARLFYQPDIHICCERIVLFLRNMFKFRDHTHFLEVYATSKEIMLFHDNGFVLLRFACGFNQSSTGVSYYAFLVDWKVRRIPWLGGYFLKVSNYFRWLFFACSFGDEF